MSSLESPKSSDLLKTTMLFKMTHSLISHRNKSLSSTTPHPEENKNNEIDFISEVILGKITIINDYFQRTTQTLITKGFNRADIAQSLAEIANICDNGGKSALFYAWYLKNYTITYIKYPC